MDWARAKTQLIYVFIVLNIFLGAMLYKRQHSAYEDFDLAEILKGHDIYLDAEIPKPATFEGKSLVYKVYTDDEIKEIFFDKPTISGTEELKTFSQGDMRVDLMQGKNIRYTNTPKPEGKLIKTVEEAEEAGKAFLKEKFGEEKLRLTNSDNKYDRFNLEFEQVDPKTNLILEFAYINLVLNENGVVSMDRRSFARVDSVKNNLEIKYPKRKLLKLIDMTGVAGRTVTGVEYCYSFDPSEIPYINNPDKVLSGDAKLALRVSLDNGRIIIIE